VGGHQVVYAVRDHVDHRDRHDHEVLILVIDTATPATPGAA
jgi:hypothetical protein